MFRKSIPDAQVIITAFGVLIVIVAWVFAFPYTPLAKGDREAESNAAPPSGSHVPSPVALPTSTPRAVKEDSPELTVSLPAVEEQEEGTPPPEAAERPQRGQTAETEEAPQVMPEEASTPPTEPQGASTPSTPAQASPSPSSTPTKASTPSPSSMKDATPSPSAAKPSSAAGHFGNRVKIKAGSSEATTVRKVSGNGVLPMRITRDPKSAAPNLPTYVSMICSNGSTYSAAYNTSAGETLAKDAPFSGECTLKVKTAYPTPKWNGTHNAIYVSTGSPEYASGDRHYTTKAGWKTRPVSDSSDFQISTPAGLKGSVVVKLTGCSSRGGASDTTAKYACDGHINKTSSKGYVQIINGGKVVNTMNYNISVNKHHDTFTIPVSLSSENVTVRVVKTSGASVLVHGPGSSVTGVY